MLPPTEADWSEAVKLFQVNEDDLAELERVLPQWADFLSVARHPVGDGMLLDNRMRTQIQRVQIILRDIRWNYGPPDVVKIIPAESTEPQP